MPAAIRPPVINQYTLSANARQSYVRRTNIVEVIEESQTPSPVVQRKSLSKVGRPSQARCSGSITNEDSSEDEHSYILRSRLDYDSNKRNGGSPE